MYADLQAFLAALERAGELHRVRAEVSPLLEITEIADRHSKAAAPSRSEAAMRFDPLHADRGGKALLFEHVAGCDFPLAINVFGSYRRMELALGCDSAKRPQAVMGFEQIARRIAALVKPAPPRSIRDLLVKAREFLPLLRIGPKLKGRGICQEIVKLASQGEVNLLRLPLIKCWPLDGDPRSVGYDISPEQAGTARGQGRYITFAGMHTIHYDDRHDPRPASHNIGMYRAQLIDETHLAMHWHMHHDGAAHWRSWKRAGEARMPIAIALGGEPVMPYAATAPLPPGISELLMAGFLNGRGIPLVRCKTVPLRVPANSEIVIEGWVSTECGDIGFDPRNQRSEVSDQKSEAQSDQSLLTSDLRPLTAVASPASGVASLLGPGAAFEGPFGDHTGFYSLPDRYPIVEVTAITHRRNAVFPATIVGVPPMEDYYMGKATERIFLPLLRTIIHDIEDYHLPMFGCFHNCALIRITKAYPLQARRVMHAVWGAGQMAWTKFIVVVDHDVDVHDETAVLRAMMQHCHFARDLEIVNGPLDILDHAAPRLGAGCKLGFDATRTIAGEDVNGIPITARQADATSPPGAPHDAAHVRFPDWGLGRAGFVRVKKMQAGDGARAIQQMWNDTGMNSIDFMVAVDASVNIDDWEAVLFHMCANCDPGRDLHRCGGRIAFDATTKLPGDERHGLPVRDFPPILAMSQEIRRRVDERCAEFALNC